MAKLIFVNRFFHPDISATSRILSDLAFALASEGHDVHVIASRRQYANASTILQQYEVTDKVVIHRVGSLASQSPGLPGRLRAYLSFYAFAARKLRELASIGNIVVAKTDPPLLSVWSSAVLGFRRITIVNWLQDVYPEVAIRFDIAFVRGPVGWILTRLRDRSLRSADANVILGSRMAEHLEGRGIPVDKLRVIPNWVDDRAIRPVARDENPLRSDWGLTGKFVLGYSGNLGRVHECETLLAAAEHFRDHDNICFLFIGGGFQYARLEAEVRRRGLERIICFKPYQDETLLAYSLGVPDAHWVSLLPEFEGLIVPSKFYGISAAGRATIAITDPDGEIARLVNDYECGAVVQPGDARELVRVLEAMVADRLMVETWGQNARAMIEQRYSRGHAMALWRGLIAEFARPDSTMEKSTPPRPIDRS